MGSFVFEKNRCLIAIQGLVHTSYGGGLCEEGQIQVQTVRNV